MTDTTETYELVKGANKLLHTKLEPLDLNHPPEDLEQVATKLRNTMNKNSGVGISANQCGLQYRMFIMRANPDFVCINPTIRWSSDEHEVMEEGCLSYPGLEIKIRRPKEVRVAFYDLQGNLITKKFGGLTARIFQHEFDHMEGVDFIKRASKFHRDKAMRKYKIKQRKMKR